MRVLFVQSLDGVPGGRRGQHPIRLLGPGLPQPLPRARHRHSVDQRANEAGAEHTRQRIQFIWGFFDLPTHPTRCHVIKCVWYFNNVHLSPAMCGCNMLPERFVSRCLLSVFKRVKLIHFDKITTFIAVCVLILSKFSTPTRANKKIVGLCR